MIIKMVNEFKLTVVHFARPNRMRMRVDLPLKRKTMEDQYWPLGLRAARPWGCHGLRACF